MRIYSAVYSCFIPGDIFRNLFHLEGVVIRLIRFGHWDIPFLDTGATNQSWPKREPSWWVSSLEAWWGSICWWVLMMMLMIRMRMTKVVVTMMMMIRVYLLVRSVPRSYFAVTNSAFLSGSSSGVFNSLSGQSSFPRWANHWEPGGWLLGLLLLHHDRSSPWSRYMVDGHIVKS